MLQIGTTKEINNVRLHRYTNSIEVTNLDNAGKRGKMVKIISAHSYDSSDMLKLASALDKVENFTAAHLSVNSLSVDTTSKKQFYKVSFRERKGVRITPAGFKVIELENDKVYIQADNDSFRIADRVDQNNCPRAVDPLWGRKQAEIKKFYKWASTKVLENESFNDILRELDSAGIDYHQYLGMD